MNALIFVPLFYLSGFLNPRCGHCRGKAEYLYCFVFLGSSLFGRDPLSAHACYPSRISRRRDAVGKFLDPGSEVRCNSCREGASGRRLETCGSLSPISYLFGIASQRSAHRMSPKGSAAFYVWKL
ncbi:hypothetical protein GGS24DRAFT_325176 [Hypoxylon argillaceum]|nr:hypothetical protein GGS24DRAFT_325176 [Hypoxylon argillaceum]